MDHFIQNTLLKDYVDVQGFAGIDFRDSLLVTTDGVGTKTWIASLLERYEDVGRDLVSHCINDILAMGGEPRTFVDYIAMPRFSKHILHPTIQGIHDVCKDHDIRFLGGETALMDCYKDKSYDLVGTMTGHVRNWTPVEEGDMLVGALSTGLHTNGYTKARQLLGLTNDEEHDRMILSQTLDGYTIGALLMRPHKAYAHLLLPLHREKYIAGYGAHITGGGIPKNLPRMFPQGLTADIDVRHVPLDPLTKHLRKQMTLKEAYETFNMGIGFIYATKKRWFHDDLLLGHVVKGDHFTMRTGNL